MQTNRFKNNKLKSSNFKGKNQFRSKKLEENTSFQKNINDFPELTKSAKIKEENNKKQKINFSNLSFIEVEKEVEEDNYKKGWTILKKDLKRNIISQIDKHDTKEDQNNKYIFEGNNQEEDISYEKLVNNWEKYREEKNDYLEEFSPFLENDLELQRMLEEERYIQKEIEESNMYILSQKEKLKNKNNSINEDAEEFEYFN